MYKQNSDRKPWGKPKFWLFFPVLFIAIAAILGWVVMYLWNAILPEVTSAKPLHYWQALGLLVLCRILFGGFRGGHQGGPWGRGKRHLQEKWMNMNEEERAHFRSEWAKRCRPNDQD